MATLCRAYTSEQEAHDAVDRLLSAGFAGADVRVLMGEALHDSRDAAVGTFAGTTSADGETVGSYAGAGHSGREAMGSFAGDADAQRRGGFRDVDRETVTTYSADVMRLRIASHHNLGKMLVDAGLDEATARADVEALHEGRVLVLVQSAGALDDIARVIDA
jgi:hypothetical protein